MSRNRIVLLPAFIWVESRCDEPILPLSLFRNRTFAATSAIGFIVGFALFGAVTYLPLYLQITKGLSPTKSGLPLTSVDQPKIAAGTPIIGPSWSSPCIRRPSRRLSSLAKRVPKKGKTDFGPRTTR